MVKKTKFRTVQKIIVSAVIRKGFFHDEFSLTLAAGHLQFRINGSDSSVTMPSMDRPLPGVGEEIFVILNCLVVSRHAVIVSNIISDFLSGC